MTDLKHLSRQQEPSCLIPALQAFAVTVIILVLFVFVAAEVPKAIEKEMDNRSAVAAAAQRGE